MAPLIDLPVEVILDNLLTLLDLPDLAHLACTNKLFATLAADETFWKRKCQADFNFSGAGTARTSGWKFIYSGLSKPRANGRLGLSKFPKTPLRDVSMPTQLRVRDARIVCTLNGSTQALRSDGYAEPGKVAHSPLRLDLPIGIRTISCGRLHAASLDTSNYIWNFSSWGRPFRLTSPRLRGRDGLPVQVECGWAFSSALSRSGDIYVWWPTEGAMGAAIRGHNEVLDADRDNHDANKGLANDNGVIQCASWDLDTDPVVLPPLPALPQLNTSDEDDETTRIIQIAAYDCALVALTNKGHVVKFGSLSSDSTVSGGVWEYLPQFSEVDHVRTHEAFKSSGNVDPPQALKITHVSAHFKHFIAYSTGPSSVVLIGDMQTTIETRPRVIPELQNRSVISVVLGDYHYAALTADGKLLTWGAYSNGALGLGDPTQIEIGNPGAFHNEAARQMAISRERGTPPEVLVPTEVRFDHKRKTPKDRFCLSATASGWHTGALVIDLEANRDEEESEGDGEALDDDDRSPPDIGNLHPHMPHRYQPLPVDPNMAPFRGGLPHFRIGFAGRGMNRGGLMGRGRGGGPGPSGDAA
ncbi:regulator of chromosome condensation 1/beta-lactamase-inhibitor protein II [Mucidula mucida]|nr:regulator of chromosome condensation 1/beta-lactamase-inhibitor protein II [Mucidula mucida]